VYIAKDEARRFDVSQMQTDKLDKGVHNFQLDALAKLKAAGIKYNNIII
jgi:hypothetical protein